MNSIQILFSIKYELNNKINKNNWYPTKYPSFIQSKLIQSNLILFNYYQF
jgi:hypothetical protein